MREKPLSGIRVLDLTRLMPGSVCTQHLADMGADIIKIEDTWEGDYGRSVGAQGKATSLYFRVMNRNKRGLNLNLKQPRGQALFLKLARDADVVIESFRPGVVDKLGIGYRAVKAVNPRIVYCSISGYGQTGPYHSKAGHDINYCGYAGIIDQIGRSGEAPVVPNYQIADVVGGSLSAVMGILAAIIDVQRCGAGRYVDVSMTDCCLAHSFMPLIAQSETGESPLRGKDLLSGALPNYGVYATADDRYMALGAIEGKFWNTFCKTIERTDLISKHQLSGVEADELRVELAEIFRSNTQAYWVEQFADVDCCVTPILNIAEAMDNPQLRERGMFITAQHPPESDLRQFAFPVKFSGFDFSIERPAPMHGEHTKEVLAQAGFSDNKIAELEEQGIISCYRPEV